MSSILAWLTFQGILLTMVEYNFEGKTAVVTGAARGIGLAITRRLLASGARVSLWDCDHFALEQSAQSLEGSFELKQADVSNPEAVTSAANTLLSSWGPVELLVNNAGVVGTNINTWEYPLDEWDRVLQTDLTSVFLCCRALIPQMIDNNYGRVVNMASLAGKEGIPCTSAYSAAKAGIIALTKTLGKELADYNIAVNCVTPSLANTDIAGQLSKSLVRYALSRTPRKRMVEVDEIASLVGWLLSGENSFSTGAVFDITGGRASY